MLLTLNIILYTFRRNLFKLDLCARDWRRGFIFIDRHEGDDEGGPLTGILICDDAGLI